MKITAIILTIGIMLNGNITAIKGTPISTYKENGITHTELATKKGNFVCKGKFTAKKSYTIIYDTMGTKTVYDDKIICIK